MFRLFIQCKKFSEEQTRICKLLSVNFFRLRRFNSEICKSCFSSSSSTVISYSNHNNNSSSISSKRSGGWIIIRRQSKHWPTGQEALYSTTVKTTTTKKVPSSSLSTKTKPPKKKKDLPENSKSSEGTGEMSRVLNVAEKNDAAKRIAHLLAGGAQNVNVKEGYSVYNKLYEFNYQFRGRPAKMTMTSVSGHLLNCEFPNQYRGWHNVDPVELFDARVNKVCPENMTNIKRTLEQQAAYAQVLIIWTDCDREGENIGFEIINVCKAINPRLQIHRAKFSEITNMAITRAISNLIAPDERTSLAVDVRQELDLRIGAAFTRFQTLQLQRKFATLQNHVISYGSCQFPTLGFVVERYKAIQDFVPEQFWKIEVAHQVDGCSIDFQWARVRLFNELACLTIYEKILDNPLAKVKKVSSRPKSKWRPVALDTVEFEKLASRKLRINAKEAMKIAEKLYTQGIISYPRTETNIFPKGLNLSPLIDMQKENPHWGAFARGLAAQGPNPRNGRKSDEAHPPIHPTRLANDLRGNDAKIYELIVRHFLACCSKDALGHETTVEIEISDENFVGHGLRILERNYLEVYIYDKWSEKELPHFEEGQEFYPTTLEMNGSETSPPALLTEADLISLMEKHGIGTDATHAEHIEKIKERTYVGVQGDGRFVPGFLGIGLVEGYDDMDIAMGMSKPNLRAELEVDLKKICDGTRNPDDVLNEQIQKYKNVFIKAKRQVQKLDSAVQKFLPNNPPGQPPPPPQRYNNQQPQQNQPRYNNNNYNGNQTPGRPARGGGSVRARGGGGAPARGSTRGGGRGANNRGGGGNRGGATNPGGGGRAPRLCGICKEPGHNRNHCPLQAIADNEDDDFDFD